MLNPASVRPPDDATLLGSWSPATRGGAVSCSLGSWTPSAAPSLAGLAVAAHRPSPRTPGPHHGFASRISAQAGTALRPSPSSTRGPPASRPALNGNAVSSELAQHLCGLSGAPALPLDQTQPAATVWPIGRRPSPRGSVFIQVIQGQATNPDALRAELDRWKVELQQVPTAGWALPPALPTTADSSPWSGLRPRSWPAATATGPSRMPGGARRPSTWSRSPSTTPRGCTSIGRAGRTRLVLFRGSRATARTWSVWLLLAGPGSRPWPSRLRTSLA